MRVHGADEDSRSPESPEPFVHPDDCNCHACKHKTVYDKQKGKIASEDSVKEGDQLTVVGSNASTAVTGLQSATGLAEGCGLSVAGMMITNIVMHRYMSLRCPDIHMLSYVDNWEMNAETVEEVQQGMHQLERFCDLWDLQLDQSKTVYWSVNAHDRKTLRQANRTVIRSCRDLGGHRQFTKQKTNSTLAIKCDNIKKLWPRLNQCRAPLRHKTKVLRCKAWPRVLHSSPGVHVNPHIFANLRSGAMQGLGLNKSGASSLIQLSSFQHMTQNAMPFSLVFAMLEDLFP